MQLEFDKDRLLELMHHFHTLTGFRIVLFDDNHQQILSVPDTDCPFCTEMKNDTQTRTKCLESDLYSFNECKKKKKLIIYRCHANRIEATIPLIENHIVIGYLMFGQLSDVPDEKIQAAAKILEATTFYVIYDKLIKLGRQNFIEKLQAYISEHIIDPLDSHKIAHGLGMSRSQLYLFSNKYLGTGIAEYIRQQRIDHAKKLLKTTDLPITEVAKQSGFLDYTYFYRVFKKVTGHSPKNYRVM